jgi:aspartyl-tRNA synthetase
MKLTNIDRLKDKQKVHIQGFVVSLRNKTNLAFLVVQDLYGKVQITINKTNTPQFNELLNSLTLQSVIQVSGLVVKNPQVKLNGQEIIPYKITVVSLSANVIPVDQNSLIDQKLDYR